MEAELQGQGGDAQGEQDLEDAASHESHASIREPCREPAWSVARWRGKLDRAGSDSFGQNCERLLQPA